MWPQSQPFREQKTEELIYICAPGATEVFVVVVFVRLLCILTPTIFDILAVTA